MIERTHIRLQLFHASTASPLLCVMMSGVALCNVTVLHSDNSFEVYVDQNLVNSGNLLEDMRSLSVLLCVSRLVAGTTDSRRVMVKVVISS